MTPALDLTLDRRFHRAVILLVLLYTALESAYVLRLPLVMDEFDGAAEVFRLTRAVPYRDFLPYKTVLGYYAQIPALLLAQTIWGRILAVKLELVLLNGAMLALLAEYCGRFLRRSAVVAALALLILSTPFLERSAELRVDMLTGWAGVWSFVLLARRRYALAGLACGLSFLLSQKGVLYVPPAEAALGTALLLSDRQGRPALVRGLLTFNGVAAATVAVYVAFWAACSSLSAVLTSTFVSAAQAGTSGAYVIRAHFWTQILLRNPGYFVLASVAIAVLLFRGKAESALVGTYGAVLLAEAAAYPQPWPYFFVLLVPGLGVVIAAYLDHRMQRSPSDPFGMPRAALLAVVVAALVYPAHRIVIALARSNAYQLYNVRLAETLLGPGETYLAGDDIIHDRQQSPREFDRVDALGLQRVTREWPRIAGRVYEELRLSPPKLVIGTYRVYNLPRPFLEAVDSSYARLSGSIRLYAPLIEAGRHTGVLGFGGRYQVDSRNGSAVMIDGLTIASGQRVELRRGTHTVVASGPVRLRLIPPEVERLLDPRFVEEQDFYPSVYEY